MARKIFIDSSAFIALKNRSDQFHDQARFCFETLLQQKTLMLTSDYVLDETITAIRFRKNHREAVTFIKELAQVPLLAVIPIYPVYFKQAINLLMQYKDKEFSFTDCTSFAYMQGHEISTAFTFDHHFKQAGFTTMPLDHDSIK